MKIGLFWDPDREFKLKWEDGGEGALWKNEIPDKDVYMKPPTGCMSRCESRALFPAAWAWELPGCGADTDTSNVLGAHETAA